MITVYVGPEFYPFPVYKELLCHDSPFFKAALEGSFEEGEEQALSLPDDDVEAFKTYQMWLNTTQFRYNFDHVEWWLCFAKLWILGDKIRSIGLMNTTVDAICATIERNDDLDWASPRTACYIFDNSKTSPLAKLVVQHAYYTPRESPHTSQLAKYPSAFLAQLTSVFLVHARLCPYNNRLGGLTPATLQGPRYHLECSNDCCKETAEAEPSD